MSFEGRGCAISTASASLMTETLKGKTLAEAEALFKGFHAASPARGRRACRPLARGRDGAARAPEGRQGLSRARQMRDARLARLRGGAEGAPSAPPSRPSRHMAETISSSSSRRRGRERGCRAARARRKRSRPTARVLEALKTVHDPEIPVNLVELGLIYELIVNRDGTVYVEMTLTTPACPVAGALPGQVKEASPRSRASRRRRQAGVDPALDARPHERGSQARTWAAVNQPRNCLPATADKTHRSPAHPRPRVDLGISLHAPGR